MGRRKIHVFGPSLLDTVERGDQFQKGARVLTVVRKEYQADLSLIYFCTVKGGWKKTARLSEKTLQYPGAAGYRRIHKTMRKVL